MAESKPIQSSQIAEPNVLDPLKKEFKELNSILETTSGNLKALVSESAKIAKSTPLDSYENIEKVEKSIGDATTAIQELDKVEKDRLKLQAKIKELDDDRVKVNFELKERIAQQTKALKEEAKEAVNNKNAYEKLIDSKKKAEQELLRLTTTFGKNSKEVQEAKKQYEAIKDEIGEVNSVLKEEETAFEKLNSELKEAKKNAQDVATEFGAKSKQAEEAKNKFLELKKEVQDVNESLREEVNLDAYQKLQKETLEAQKEGKRLTVELGKNAKQTKEATKRFENLSKKLEKVDEKFKDGRKSVGLYEKGTKKLTTAFKVFASATVVLKALELLQKSIGENSDGAAELEKVWVRVTTVVEVFARRVVDVFPIISAKVERFFLNIQIQVTELTNNFKINEESTEDLTKRYEELAGVASQDLAPAFESMGNEIDVLLEKKTKLIDDTLKYRREIVGLEQDIAKLIPTQAKARAGFEDDSKSLEEQIGFGIELIKVTQQRFLNEEKISAKRLKLAQDNAKANSVSVSAQEELAAATKEYNQLIADQASEIASTEKELQKVRDDVTQLNLDFYIDDLDNKKTVNERIIADETQTYKRRRQLLSQNLKDTEIGFDLEEEALNRSLRERGKAQLDFDELRKTSSSEEIARIVTESGISEPLAIRALEVLRERRTFLQDNAEAQRDLNDAEDESKRLQDDIILQKEALNRLDEEGVDLQMVLDELSKQRLQSDIDNLNERISVTEEGSARFIALNQELNDKLLEQDQANFEKRKQELEKYSKATDAAFQVISDLNSKRNEKRLNEIDDEISAEEARLSALQALAAEGNEDAENNLAVTEKRQAELELQREQQLKRQKQSELALTAIQTYSGKVTNGDSNPLASTISDISVLRAFISTLPAFYEGSEMVGDDLNPVMKGRDGHIIRVDGSERVLTGEQNRLIGNMSNNELANMAHKAQKTKDSPVGTSVIIQELRELKTATKNKPSYMGSDIDNISGMITHRVKSGNKMETRHVKQGGVWG